MLVVEALFGEEGIDEAEDGLAVRVAELLEVAQLAPELLWAELTV